MEPLDWVWEPSWNAPFEPTVQYSIYVIDEWTSILYNYFIY